jgi:hypothetical protein
MAAREDQEDRYRRLLRRELPAAAASPPAVGELTSSVSPLAVQSPPSGSEVPIPSGRPPRSVAGEVCTLLAKGTAAVALACFIAFLAGFGTMLSLPGMLVAALLGNMVLLALCSLLLHIVAVLLRPGGENV